MFSNSFNRFLTAKPTISVGQALLILMDTYQKDKEFLEELKVLYLVGANTDENLTRINQLLRDKALRQYSISREKSCISEDPTRRYFESMLSWGTVYSEVSLMNAEALEHMLQTIFVQLSPESQHSTQCLANDYDLEDDMIDSPEQEIQIALRNIGSGTAFKEFTQEDKNILVTIVLSVNTSLDLISEVDLPLDIYGKGYFKPTHRGRITKSFEDQANVRSHNLGLLKSYMPLPVNHSLYCKVAHDYLRIADKNTFEPNALWVSHSFESLVHPFSASISGTMLAFLRTLNYLHQNGVTEFTEIEDFSLLIKLTASLFLVNGGGHSLNEYLFLLQLPEVQEAFAYIVGFNTELTLEKLFLPNKEIFDFALNHTIDYHKTLLNKAIFHAQLKERHRLNKANEYGVVNSEQSSDTLTQSCSTSTSTASTKSVDTAKLYAFLNDEFYDDKNSEESSDDNTQSCSVSSRRK